MSLSLPPAEAPTIHFIGVSTTQSSIMQVFPKWVTELGIHGATIHGIDLALNAPPESYREVVNFIRNDDGSRGALVTTHKIDLFRAARDQFDELDWFATAMHEISSISKRNGKQILIAVSLNLYIKKINFVLVIGWYWCLFRIY